MATKRRTTLEGIEDKLDALIATLVGHISDDKESFKAVFHLLQGAGEQLGLKGKIDRLEQTDDQRRWQRRAMWTAIIALGTTMFAKVFNFIQ